MKTITSTQLVAIAAQLNDAREFWVRNPAGVGRELVSLYSAALHAALEYDIVRVSDAIRMAASIECRLYATFCRADRILRTLIAYHPAVSCLGQSAQA